MVYLQNKMNLPNLLRAASYYFDWILAVGQMRIGGCFLRYLAAHAALDYIVFSYYHSWCCAVIYSKVKIGHKS